MYRYYSVCSEENSWSQPKVNGSPPCSRHGHVSVAVGADIYVHGGMAGTNMFDDLYRFNTGMHTNFFAVIIMNINSDINKK